MLEAGLALIACCQPTLQALIARESLNSMVASVRNMVSLQSFRSTESQKSRTYGQTLTAVHTNDSSASHAHALHKEEAGSVETYAMHDRDATIPVVLPGEIRVWKDVTQIDDMV